MRGSSIIPPSGDFYRHREEATKPPMAACVLLWFVSASMLWNLIALVAGAVIGP